MEMAVTGCSSADFVVFTTSEGQHDLFVQRVKFDADFWRACSGVLCDFFQGVCSFRACYKKAEAQQKLATTVTVVMLSVLSLA